MEHTEEKISRSKRYYEKNKEWISAKESLKMRWLEYYDKNKEAIKERNRQRYHQRKALLTASMIQQEAL